jgi:hypothetical protein
VEVEEEGEEGQREADKKDEKSETDCLSRAASRLFGFGSHRHRITARSFG